MGEEAMNPPSSVSDSRSQLQEGERQAAYKIWQRYYPLLLKLARKQLGTVPTRMADAEDVVQEAFSCFFQALEEGRYPDLRDRDDLWHVLLMITRNKAVNYIEHEQRDKRNWKRTLLHSEMDSDKLLFQELLQGREPDPAEVAEVADRLEWLLTALPESLVQMARLKMEGYTNAEIATRLDCAESTVERRMIRVRRHLEAHYRTNGKEP
jgi:RNA polymerase sigma factor (sigma-70 family)